MDPGPSYKQLEVKTKTNINKVNNVCFSLNLHLFLVGLMSYLPYLCLF